MHVQSCCFAVVFVVVVLSCCRGGGCLSSLLLVADPGGAGPGAASPPLPRYPKDRIPGSTTHYCIKSSCSGAKLEKFRPPTLDHF